MKGTIVKFDNGRKFGFIRPAKGRGDDVFFHLTDVADGASKLVAGASVRYEIAHGDNGPKAIQVISVPTSPYSFYLCAAAIIGALTMGLLRMYTQQTTIFADYLVGVTIAAFVLVGFDKSISGSATMRVPEKVLFCIAAAGGSLGLFSGMQFFRHKRRKPSFDVVLIAIVVFQVALARVTHVSLRSFLVSDSSRVPGD